MAQFQKLVRKREIEVADLTRLLQKHGGYLVSTAETLDIAELQGDLGGDSALVEYFGLDGEMLAFVVTNENIEVIRHLGSEEEIEAAVVQLNFQIDSLRNGALPLHNRMEELAGRMRHCLCRLYDLLLRPLEGLLDGRRLVVVPHGVLHYVPFHALHDGTGYIIERREVSYAPSASILRHCLTQPQRQLRRALLLGCADERLVRVENEVRVLAPLFSESKVLLGEEATLEALYTFAPDADVLHIACHGQFRPDNPLFSSLGLADGSLTARDAYHLDLRCGLVTLSACETGMSEIAPGDELIGLARGFFAAGAPSLLVSLWNVDDDSTAMLMTDFYTRLQAGDRPAAALRHAQRAALKQHAHPFFWSPFLLLGRW
jgi:CHAT domain-containing protein